MSGTLDLNALQGGGVLNALAHPSVVNPVADYGAAAQTANAIWGIRKQKGEQAWGDALAQSTDANGNVDLPKAQALAAKMGPDAALVAQQSLLNTSTLSNEQQTRGANTQKAINNAAIAGQQAPPGQVHNVVAAQVQNLIDTGAIPRDKGMQWLASFPNDEAAARAQLEHIRLTTMGPEQQQTQLYGAGSTQVSPTGATVGTIHAPPGGLGAGGVQQGGSVTTTQGAGAPVGPSPDTVFSAPGQYVPDTRPGALPGSYMQVPRTYPGAGGAASPPAPAAGNAATPGSGTASSPPAAPPQVSLSAPSGVQEAAQETAKTNAKLGQDLVARADQVPNNRANFATMLTEADKLDAMGPGTDKQAYLNALSQKWLGSGLLGNATPAQIAASEKFSKLANMITGTQLSQLGATDARQQLAIGANPHADLSKLGNQQIIHMLQGNEDAIQAKAQAWQEWTQTHGTASYGDFQNEFNKRFDLRVFQQQYMNPEERQDLRKQLQSQNREPKFLADLKYAQSRGWVP